MAFVPNEGEILAVLAKYNHFPMEVGLYRNSVPTDGGVTYPNITELTTGGGRAYARKTIYAATTLTAATQYRWYVYTDTSGRGYAIYRDGAAADKMTWTLNATDVADGYSIYGAFAVTRIIPFDAGATAFQIGDVVKGHTSGATATVYAVWVFSGTWAAGTAAGYLVVGGQTGTFQNDENLYVSGEIGTLNATPTAGGTGYALGDLFQITTTGFEAARGIVTAQGGGIVTSVHLATGGQGYTTGTGKATVKITGAGDDALTVNITALATTAYAVSNTGTVNAGDSHQKVLAVFPKTTAITVSTTPVDLTLSLAASTG